MKIKSFPPVIAHGARILILGSIPGEESLRRNEYYGHPKNIFWQIAGSVCDFDCSLPYNERTKRLLEAGFALWDVIGYCHRKGSADSDIKDAECNDFEGLLKEYPSVKRIVLNGKLAFRLFEKHFGHLQGIEIVYVPSSSPANASIPLKEKLAAWHKALTP